MAIVIVNVSSDMGLQYGKGDQVYQLQINQLALFRFTHRYEDGLAECLRKAAAAAQAMEDIEAVSAN